MPAAAIIGAAVVGAGASIVSANKNSKAISQATDAQTQQAAAANALQEKIYGQNVERSTPFVNSGLGAQAQLNALLGLGGDTGAANQAFDTFRNGTNYNFQFGEGQRSLNTGYAARGLLNSGAAQKAAINYGQNQASGALGNYINLLSNQQGVGLSASNALSGVGTNYANAVSNNNANAADAIGNGAIARANNNNALFGNIAGIAGQTAGQLSSYGSYGGGGYVADPNQMDFSRQLRSMGSFG